MEREIAFPRSGSAVASDKNATADQAEPTAESRGGRRLQDGRQHRGEESGHHRPQQQRLLRRHPRAEAGEPRHRAQRGRGPDRALGLRQVDVHPLPEPHERHDRIRAGHGRLPARRPGHLFEGYGRRAAARAGRHGVPEAQPVSRSPSTRTSPMGRGFTAWPAAAASSTTSSTAAWSGPGCWTRSRAASTSRAPGCRAASSSGCASPVPSP